MSENVNQSKLLNEWLETGFKSPILSNLIGETDDRKYGTVNLVALYGDRRFQTLVSTWRIKKLKGSETNIITRNRIQFF